MTSKRDAFIEITSSIFGEIDSNLDHARSVELAEALADAMQVWIGSGLHRQEKDPIYPINPNTGKPIKNEHYVGDGVFASFDGANIWLRASRITVDHFIALNADNWPSIRDYCVQFFTRCSSERMMSPTPVPGPSDDI